MYQRDLTFLFQVKRFSVPEANPFFFHQPPRFPKTMDSHSAARAPLMLTTLSKNRDKRTEEVYQSATAPPFSDEETPSQRQYPIVDTFYAIDGDSTMRQMMNFNLEELKFFFEVVKTAVQMAFSIHGRKPDDTYQDKFFILPFFIENGGTWHYNADMFRKKASVFEKFSYKVLHSVK